MIDEKVDHVEACARLGPDTVWSSDSGVGTSDGPKLNPNPNPKHKPESNPQSSSRTYWR